MARLRETKDTAARRILNELCMLEYGDSAAKPQVAAKPFLSVL
jgi:hypothetical protein